jgi:predicted RNA binding protein YcfA (HicA-like mRNA interferase family)
VPPFGPIKRRDLIRYLRQAGFEGPYSGGKHQFMEKEDITISIPHPHQGDMGREFLVRILRQAQISRDEWEKL